MLLFVIVATACLLVMSRQNSKSAVVTAHTVSTEPQTWLAISGDVRYPGLYLLPADGMTASSVVESEPDCPLPMLIPLANSTRGVRLQVSCPSSKDAADITLQPLTIDEQLVLDIPLDLNSVNLEQLQKIQGIGPVMAQRIITARDEAGGFTDLAQLLTVKGIGNKRLQQFSEYLQVVE